MGSGTGADVVIIGGGVEGLSVAWALARRGVSDVIVLERDTVGSGFTAKSSGIIRCHYGVRSIAAMAWRSLPVLETAAEAFGADIGFHRCGYLVGVGWDNEAPLRANVAAQQGLGIEVELLAPAEITGLFPQLRLDDFALFAWEHRGAYGDGYQTAQAFAHAARDLGVVVRQGAAVAKIETAADRVSGVVLATGDRVGADRVVVASGPWTAALVAPLGVELPMRAQREQVMIVDPGEPLGPVPVLSDLVSLQYLRPERHELLVGNSDHHAPEWADPDHYDNIVDDRHVFEAIEKFSIGFRALGSAGLSSSYAGCYDVTPDYNPVIGPAPLEGLWLCAGFSGHGYKISPAVGDLMADLLCEGTSTDPDVDADDFRLRRFAEGDLLLSPHPYIGAGQMR